jgi:hypothetical protein
MPQRESQVTKKLKSAVAGKCIEQRRRCQLAGLDAQVAAGRSVADCGALNVAPSFGTPADTASINRGIAAAIV